MNKFCTLVIISKERASETEPHIMAEFPFLVGQGIYAEFPHPDEAGMRITEVSLDPAAADITTAQEAFLKRDDAVIEYFVDKEEF
jgi:hypothetical protein